MHGEAECTTLLDVACIEDAMPAMETMVVCKRTGLMSVGGGNQEAEAQLPLHWCVLTDGHRHQCGIGDDASKDRGVPREDG